MRTDIAQWLAERFRLAERIARICTEANVPRLIHVSHLNANPESTSEFYRTKYEGEVAVRRAFPTATIVRPSSMYGHEDFLLHAAARFPHLFKLNGGRTRFLPVHVTDVATALEVMINAPVTSEASTFALPGPSAYTYDDILEAVSFFAMKPKSKAMSVPKPFALLFAHIFNRAIWWPTQSPDEIERRYIDDVGVSKFYAQEDDFRPSGWGEAKGDLAMTGVDGEPIKTWSDLNLEPSLLEETAIRYLRNYRSSYVISVESMNLILTASGPTSTNHWRWADSKPQSRTTYCHEHASHLYCLPNADGVAAVVTGRCGLLGCIKFSQASKCAGSAEAWMLCVIMTRIQYILNFARVWIHMIRLTSRT